MRGSGIWNLLLPALLFFDFDRIQGCNHGEHEVDRRKKRNTPEEEATDTARLRDYFTRCLQQRLSAAGYVWQTNVDYTVLDTIWYENTDQAYCSPGTGGNNVACWKEQLGNLVSDQTVLREARICIDHFAEDTFSGQDRYRPSRKKRQSGYVKPPTAFSTCLTRSSYNLFEGVIRARMNFPALSAFVRNNFRDPCDQTRPYSARDSTTGYLLVSLTRSISPLRETARICTINTFPPPDYFSDWGAWGRCSSSCGTGRQTRRRSCRSGVNPDVAGVNCVGRSDESRSCTGRLECNYNWGRWGAYSICTATCGGGTQVRNRHCLLNGERRVGNDFCRGENSQTRPCNTNICHTTGRPRWTTWTPWTQCSGITPCYSSRSRSRRCLQGNRQVASRFCGGLDVESGSCTGLLVCNYNWDRWGAYSKCTATCGGGTQVRNRHCLLNGERRVGNDFCRGENSQTRPCNTNICHTTGRPRWTTWTPWTQCSGITPCYSSRSRSRRCLQGNRQVASRFCGGLDVESGSCTGLLECNYNWGRWGAYSSCSKSCGGGTQVRRRLCLLNGERRVGNHFCRGRSSQTRKCITRYC